MNKTALAHYNNNGYKPEASAIKRLAWLWANALFLKSSLLPFSSLKAAILRLFGAKIGDNAVIRSGITIKYPWFLVVGNNVWIGENVWIDNLAETLIEDNVCISQGAMLLTGNHNFNTSTFDLIVAGITLEEGVWLGAQSVVCPGVTCKSHSVLAVGSVATKTLEAYSIYQGNPAVRVKSRAIQ